MRTPSQIEAADALGFPAGAPFIRPGGGLFMPYVIGNGDPEAEVLWAYELGYRLQATRRWSFDVAAFYNRYDNLLGLPGVRSFVPGAPFGVAEIPFLNVSKATSYGAEFSVVHTVSDTLRINASVSLLQADIERPDGFNASDYNDGFSAQLALGVAWDFTRTASIDFSARHVTQDGPVPDYVAADLRISWRPNDRLELALIGRNLLESSHA